MKKIICLLLTLTLIVFFGSICFAAVDAYDTEFEELIGEDTPGASVDTLPKTGGLPAETFYVAGVLIIAAALVISRKKAKVTSKN